MLEVLNHPDFVLFVIQQRDVFAGFAERKREHRCNVRVARAIGEFDDKFFKRVPLNVNPARIKEL